MKMRTIGGWGAGVVLTALYAYIVIAAVGNMVGMASLLGSVLRPTAWIALGTGIAAPVIGYALALILGRGRSGGVRLLLLTTGLCVTAALQLDMLHLMG